MVMETAVELENRSSSSRRDAGGDFDEPDLLLSYDDEHEAEQLLHVRVASEPIWTRPEAYPF